MSPRFETTTPDLDAAQRGVRDAGRRWMLAALLVPVFLGTSWIVGVGLVDDAYIFLRYASNADHGFGLVFNPGERVEGYTSPLWLVLVLPLFAIAKEPSTYLMILGAICGLASVLLVALRRSVLAGLFLATHPAFVFWSFSGLETPLVSLCLLGTFLFLMDSPLTARRVLLGGASFSLAVLARPDAVWVLPFVAWRIVAASWGYPRRLARMIGLFAVPLAIVVVHLAWRVWYYGDWLPNTYYAKAGIPRSILAASGLRYLATVSMFLLPLVLVVPIVAREYRRALVPLFAGWLAMVVGVGGDFFAFFRFGVPLLAIVAGAIRPGSTVSTARHWMTVTLVAMFLTSNLTLALGPQRDLARREVAMARAWSRAGQTLAGLVPPGGIVATLVAGAIPYYSGHPTIDLLGLTDRHIARWGRIEMKARPGHQRYDSDYVLARRPMVIVLPDSGRSDVPRHAASNWPEYTAAERRYFQALADLIEQPATRELYLYRAVQLPDGTYLEALWLRDR